MTIKEFEVQKALGLLTYGMKIELAKNKRTSKEVLIILSTDKSWQVRYSIASNSNTPTKVLTKLLKDKDEMIRNQANHYYYYYLKLQNKELKMKIKLVFEDWRDRNHKSVYSTEKGVDLSTGDFHSGTTFNATIEVDDPEELKESLRQGYIPVFYVIEA